MFSWLQRLLGKKKAPETPTPSMKGARPVRREKTYSADTGYVYQYYYEGYRETRWEDQEGQEHVFNVTVDRSSRFPIRVFLGRPVIESWEQSHERELNAAEQYAVVKMTLFETFDERNDLGGNPAEVRVSESDIEKHCATLDL